MVGNLLREKLSSYTSKELLDLITKGEIPRIADEVVPIRGFCDCGEKAVYMRFILVHSSYLRYIPKTVFLCGECYEKWFNGNKK